MHKLLGVRRCKGHAFAAVLTRAPLWQDRPMRSVDRIDQDGNATEHKTVDGARTLCGLQIVRARAPTNARKCKRCERTSGEWTPDLSRVSSTTVGLHPTCPGFTRPVPG